MRFACACGCQYATPVPVIIGEVILRNDETGEEFVMPPGTWLVDCPACGATNSAINQVTLVGDDNSALVGFAETPSEFAALRRELEELQASKRSLSVIDVADALESRPGLGSQLGQWLRDHKDELGALGGIAGILSLLLSAVIYMEGKAQRDAPPPPPGISKEQFSDLIDTLGRAVDNKEADKDECTECGQAHCRRHQEPVGPGVDQERDGEAGS